MNRRSVESCTVCYLQSRKVTFKQLHNKEGECAPLKLVPLWKMGLVYGCNLRGI